MKTNKKSATVPSTEGSNTTPQRQEALTEKADVAKKDIDNVSDGLDDDEDDEMQDDDSISCMRLDSEICLPRGKLRQISQHTINY